jgi:nuclear receptor, other families, insect
MNVSAVQNERGPRRRKIVIQHKAKKPKAENIFPDCRRREQMNPLAPQTTTAATTSGHQEMLIQILLTCLKQARESECFRNIIESQKNVILRNVWSELFVLKASHWPIDIGAAIESCGDRHLLDIITVTKTLSCSLMELSLLEILILSRPEYAVDSNMRLTLQLNLENAISQLELYVSQQSFNSTNGVGNRHLLMETSRKQGVVRFGKLLLGLRHLSLHLYESALNNLFRNCSERYFQFELKQKE